MSIRAAWVAAVFSVLACAAATAQQPAETAEPSATPAEGQAAPASPAAAAKADAAEPAKDADAAAEQKRVDNEALLRAQAAGYKLVNKDGREIFCKKEMVTGSRLATRTRCLTLAQIEAERNATKDMLLDMSRKTINVPQE